MQYIVALLFLFAGYTIQGQAQSNSNTPDPDSIFTDGVQWELLENVPTASPADQRHRQVRATEDAIMVFDESHRQWQSFPLPDERPLQQVAMRHNGQVVVTTGPEHNMADLPMFSPVPNLPKFYWLLNPQTGDYQEWPSVCAGTARQAFPDESGEWITVNPNDYLSVTGPFLCHTADDNTRHELLPDSHLANWRVSDTPDPNRLVLFAQDFNASGTYQIFVYDISRKQFLLSGQVSGPDTGVYLCGWVSDTRGVLCVSGRQSYLPTRFYELNITQPDNLRPLFHGWYDTWFKLENPLRFVNLHAPSFVESITGSMAADDERCILSIYDANGLQTYDMGKDCLPFFADTMMPVPFYRHNDTIYLLGMETATAPVSTLHRFDTRTLQHRVNGLSMEMEVILGISPDADYIAVLIDDDTELAYSYQNGICCIEQGGRQVAILPTNEDDFLYLSSPLGVYMSSDVMWLDNQTMIVKSRGEQQYIPSGENGEQMIPHNTRPSLHRITLDDTGYREQSITITADDSRQRDVMLDMVPESLFAIVNENQIIDLRTLETVTFLQPGVRDQYRIHLYRTYDGMIQLNLSDPANNQLLQSYRLELP